jgi:uncharacterized protein (DUF1697 family)
MPRARRVYVALFRGVNVIGRNTLPMKSVPALFEAHGCRDVRTYIQSGNVVFSSDVGDPARLAARLAAAVRRAHGFEPRVLVLTAAALARAAAANPFPEARTDPKSVHLFFLEDRPVKPDVKALEALRTPTERFALKDRVFYLHTPEGFGISKLAAGAERRLGVAATARNWRTVTTLVDMVIRT